MADSAVRTRPAGKLTLSASQRPAKKAKQEPDNPPRSMRSTTPAPTSSSRLPVIASASARASGSKAKLGSSNTARTAMDEMREAFGTKPVGAAGLGNASGKADSQSRRAKKTSSDSLESKGSSGSASLPRIVLSPPRTSSRVLQDTEEVPSGHGRNKQETGRIIAPLPGPSSKRSLRAKSQASSSLLTCSENLNSVLADNSSDRKASPLAVISPSKEAFNKKPYKHKVFFKAGLWSSPSPHAALSAKLLAKQKESAAAVGTSKGADRRGAGSGKKSDLRTGAIRSGPSNLVKPQSISSLASSALQASTILKPPDIFPPLPVHWGLGLIYGEQKDFRLPFDIMSEWEEGSLEGKKFPSKFIKLRRNVFVDRKPRYNSDLTAICHCEPDSGCGPNCINRAMNYLCGKRCPCGEACTNGALSNRPQKGYKLVWTGSRGFGVQLTEDVKAGEFVMDYRGDVISMDTFYQRIRTVYAGRKDFYALEYDADEVIDSGIRGNDGRFINHSCDPNIEVRKYQTMGQAFEEYEVGFWAKRDIKANEEIFYNYNFDSFTTIRRPKNHPDFMEAPLERRQRCHCGAYNCSGWLGKAPGEPSPDPTELEDDTEELDDSAPVEESESLALELLEDVQIAIPVPESGLFGEDAIENSASRPTGKRDTAGRSRAGRRGSLSAGTRLTRTPEWRAAVRAFKGRLPYNQRATKTLRSHRTPLTELADQQHVPGVSSLASAPIVAASSVQPRQLRSRSDGKGRSKSLYGANWRSEAELSEQKRRRRRGDTWLEAQRVALRSTLQPGDAMNYRRALAESRLEGSRPTTVSERRRDTDFMANFLDSQDSAQPRHGLHDITVNMVQVDNTRPPVVSEVMPGGYVLPPPLASPVRSATSKFDQLLNALCGFGGSRLGAGLTSFLVGDCSRLPRCLPAGGKLAKVDRPAFVQLSAAEQPYDTGELPEDYFIEQDGADQYVNPDGGGENYGDEGGQEGQGGTGGAGAPDGGGGGGGDDDPDDEGGDDEIPSDDEEEEEEQQGDPGKEIEPGPEEVDFGDLTLPESGLPELELPEDLQHPEDLPFLSMHDLSGMAEAASEIAPLEQASGSKKAYRYGRPIAKARPKAASSLASDDPLSATFSEGENGLYGVEGGEPQGGLSQADGDAPKEKKRRKKWTLPLDDATIEAERRKKKKGRRWLLDMLEAAAKRRADMIAQGIPIPSPPPQMVDLPELSLEPEVEALPETLADTMQSLAEAEPAIDLEAEPEAAPEAEPLAEGQGEAEAEAAANAEGEHVTLAAAYGDDLIEPELGSELSGADFEEMQVDAAALEDLHAMLLPPQEDQAVATSEISGGPETKVKEKKPRKPRPPKVPPSDKSGEESGAGEEGRSRKPRPARRFKTPLTRLRPKLEAAVGDFSHLTQAEEEAALEGERRRRKKGLAWLEAMKALAKAKRDAKEKLAQGLKPDEFVLPPTSLPVSGRRKTKKNLEALAARAAEEVSGVLGGSVSSGSQTGQGGIIDSHLGGSSSSTMPEIPDFMYPPDHPSRQRPGKANRTLPPEPMFPSSVTSIPLPAFFEESLAAERLAAERAEAAAAAASASASDPFRGSTLQAEVPALINAVRSVEADLANGLLSGQGNRASDLAVNGFASHSNLFSGAPDYGSIPGFDLSALRNYTHQEEVEGDEGGQEASGLQDESSDEEDEEQSVKDTATASQGGTKESATDGTASAVVRDLPSFPVEPPAPIDIMDAIAVPRSPSVAAFVRAQSTLGTTAGRKRSLSPSVSVHSESRKKRGPPVKKIAGATEEPLTDEQWEIERKKRKKGHAWVAETKAAAEAERAALQARHYESPMASATKRWASMAPGPVNFGMPSFSTARYGSHHVPTSQEEEDDRMLELAFGGPPRPRENVGSSSRTNNSNSNNNRPADIIPYPSSQEVAEPSPDIFSFTNVPSPYSPQHAPQFLMPPVHMGHMAPLGMMQTNGYGLPMMQHTYSGQQLHNGEYQ